MTVRTGQEVRNLPQLKRGDSVVVVSHEAIAFQVLKPGARKPSVSSDEDVFVAPLGEKPGAGAVQETTLVARIVKLDRSNQQATLRGPEGKTVMAGPASVVITPRARGAAPRARRDPCC